MKALAVVPARHGSKRLPRKNTRKLGGKPLINWTIETAKQVSVLCDIVVSTDSQEIASIAADAGAMVPWLRPVELSTDLASSADVAIHALDWYEKLHGRVDVLVLLQPTSPFRTAKTITDGLEVFKDFSGRPVLSVSPREAATSDSYVKRGNFIYKAKLKGNSLDDEVDSQIYYVPNGVIYLVSPQRLRDSKSFTSGEIVPLFIHSRIESIDIDTMEDWFLAEKIVALSQT